MEQGGVMGGRGALSGRKGGFGEGETGKNVNPTSLESLTKIKDKAVYSTVKEAISRYETSLGVRQRDVVIGKLPAGVGGVHITANGKSQQIVLNKGIFNKDLKSIEGWAKKGYSSGHLTKTNKPAAHIVTHELAHATWNKNMTSSKAQAAGKEIKALYKKWSNDTKKTGYGKYAKTNVNEFFAEVATKAVRGSSDKYTKAVKGIVKKYEL